jgi:eukaryotic-like serine/threonine-protein kinase
MTTFTRFAAMHAPVAEALSHFDRIVELPEAERGAALAALDPLVAAAVLELLRADAASSGVLDRGVQAFATELVGTEDASSSAGMLQAGDVMGGFVLQRLLGRGGMGEVWLAQRKDSSDATGFVQQVALKVLKRGMDSDSVSARFMQERKILAELNHPHFARFIDGGISADGRLYFAMEYVDGVNLVEHASAQNLNVRERVRLLAEVSEAVAYAQNHLVVHRDLKPSNILVDASGEVKVLDFGIAKLLGERAPIDTLTHTGVHALSPAYAAPEQVLGQAISTATDVYALGVILFELVTGTLPHTRQLISFEALIAQVNSEQTPVPSQALRKLANTGSTSSLHSARALREVAGDLDTIILTAMQREPARRYASAAALADDLRRWLDARPIAAQPDSRGYRIKKFVARNRLVVGSASTVLLALVAGLAVALWQAGVAREQANLARSQAARADRAAQQATAVRDFFVGRLIDQHITSGDILMRDWIAASLPELETQLAQSPEAQIELGISFAQALTSYGQYLPAIQAFDTAILRLQKVNYDDATRVEAVARHSRAKAYFELGDVEKSKLDLDASLALFDQVLVQSDKVKLNRINARTTLLRLASRRGDSRTALAIGQANLSDRIALFGSDAPQLAVDHHNLSSVQMQLGDYAAARRNADRALILLATQPDAGGSRRSNVLLNLALLSLAQADYAAAREQIMQGRVLRERFLPPSHPDILVCGQWEANLALLEGDLARADSALSALGELRRTKSLYYPSMLLVQVQLKLLQQRPEAALKDADEILALVPAGATPLYLPRLIAIRALAIARSARADTTALAAAVSAVNEAARATETLFEDANYSPLFKGDAAIYIAAALSALGAVEQAKSWRARGLLSFSASMDADQAAQRAQAWVGN